MNTEETTTKELKKYRHDKEVYAFKVVQMVRFTPCNIDIRNPDESWAELYGANGEVVKVTDALAGKDPRSPCYYVRFKDGSPDTLIRRDIFESEYKALA